MERRLRIHPQLRAAYAELYDELRGEGLSDEEASRRLNTDFDWSLSEVSKPVLRKRCDEFADCESRRDFEAETNSDLAAMWLEAREKGDGSHLILELILGLRGNGV